LTYFTNKIFKLNVSKDRILCELKEAENKIPV
jgi:hypothetical protein